MKPILLFFATVIMFSGMNLEAQTNPMTLTECILMAVEKNISVKQSELSLNDAEINKSDAQGNFLPTLNAQANHSWNIGLNQDITRVLLRI